MIKGNDLVIKEVISRKSGYARSTEVKKFVRHTPRTIREVGCPARMFLETYEGRWVRVRVSSVKTWVRRPERLRIKLSFGLYTYLTIDETEVGRLMEEVE